MFSFLLYSLLRIKRYNTYAWIMSCIQQGCRQRGAWGLQPPQFLTDQLTLSQPGGADYAHHSTTSPPQIFRPCDRPGSSGSLFQIFVAFSESMNFIVGTYVKNL